MANIDAAAGLTQAEINDLLGQYFTNAPTGNDPFDGTAQKTIDGIGLVTLTWKVGSAPTAAFGTPALAVWNAAYNSSGKTNGAAGTPLPTGPVIALTLPTLTATYTVGTQPAVGGTANDVVGYATLAFGSGTVTVTMVAVTLDESHFSKWDQVIFNDFLLPRIFAAIQQALGVVHIPAIAWEGVALNPIQVELNGTQLIGAATLTTNPKPLDTTGVAWPSDAVFVVASNTLVNAALAAGVKPYVGHQFSDSGEFKDLADWSYDGSVSSIAATVKTVAPLAIAADVTVSLSAKAKLTAAGMALAAVGCAVGAALL